MPWTCIIRGWFFRRKYRCSISSFGIRSFMRIINNIFDFDRFLATEYPANSGRVEVDTWSERKRLKMWFVFKVCERIFLDLYMHNNICEIFFAVGNVEWDKLAISRIVGVWNWYNWVAGWFFGWLCWFFDRQCCFNYIFCRCCLSGWFHLIRCVNWKRWSSFPPFQKITKRCANRKRCERNKNESA